MKILNLKLENFQGIKSLEIDFNGKNTNIYGDNATGKTTVFNAVTWLLFDKPSTGAKNFSPKTKDKKGDVHYLNHTVEAAFELEDGKILALKKDLYEVYRKKNGSMDKEFNGHKIDFYIDGVPVKQREYNSALNNNFGDNETMKMLTMTNYFPEIIDWEERRKILLQICGNITDQEVINSNEDLKILNEILLVKGTYNQYHTVDEYKIIASSQKAKINKLLEEIPSRIDEVQRTLPDINDIDVKAIQNKIDELNNQKNKLKESRDSSINDDSCNKIRKLINDTNDKLAKARNEYAVNNSKLNENTYKQINETNKLKMQLENEIELTINKADKTKTKIKQLEQHRQSLLDEYYKVKSEKFDESKSICPTCNRTLPDEEIEKIKVEFENNRNKRLIEINQKGKSEASKEMIEAEKKNLLLLEEQIEKNIGTVEGYNKQLEFLKNQVKEEISFETTKEYEDILEEINKLNEGLQIKKEQLNVSINNIDVKMKSLQDEINEQMSIKSKIDLFEQQQKRIDELKAQEKDYSSQFEELERNMNLCDLFIKTKVDMLTEKINSRFKTVRFRLFVEQQNGGIKNDCEVMIPSDSGNLVPFSFANNAAKINAGLEIIDTLSKHCKLKMPIFIDNAESVTNFLDIDSQVIKLIVSEKDKELRIKTEDTTEQMYKNVINF